MTRINFSSARGTSNFEKSFSTLIFAGILIVCSVAVGCSSEKPTTPISISQPPISQATPPLALSPASGPTTAEQPPAKPPHRKVVRKVPATVTYANESSGVSFQYPRKYSLKTGEDADKLVSSDAVPMNFVQPGGIALEIADRHIAFAGVLDSIQLIRTRLNSESLAVPDSVLYISLFALQRASE